MRVCLPACLPRYVSACLSLHASVALPSRSSQGALGKWAGRQECRKAARQEGPRCRRQAAKRDPRSWGITEYPSPRFTQLLSPSSPPYALPFLPSPSLPPTAFGGPAMSCMLVMRAKGRGAQKQRHNQIKSGQPLSSPPPNPGQLSGPLVLSRQSGKDSLDSA